MCSDKASLIAFASLERGDVDALLAALSARDVNIRNVVGQTLLHAAAGRFGSAAMADVLVSRGVDVNARDHEGATALLLPSSGSEGMWSRSFSMRVGDWISVMNTRMNLCGMRLEALGLIVV